MQIFQLIYVSTLVNEYGLALPAILNHATQRNRLSGIRCMMLCSHGNVMHALEGDPASIKQLFSSIENDARHFDVQLINECNVPVHELEGVCAGVDRATLQAINNVPDADCFRIDSREVRNRVKPGVARTLLIEFADSMR